MMYWANNDINIVFYMTGLLLLSTGALSQASDGIYMIAHVMELILD